MTTPNSNNDGSNNFDEILDRCLRAVESGQMTVEQCAARYPNYPELPGLLRMAIAVRDLPRPQMPGGTTLQMQRRLQAQLRERVRASAPRRSGLAAFPLRRLLLTIAVMLVIIFVGGAGVVFASADKLPGDGFLYTVKRNVEGIRLSFASQNDRPNVLYDIAETRLNEIRGLAARGTAINDAPVNDMYNSVSLAVGSLSDNAKKSQLTTDAENALQDALNKGMINPALAQLTTQKLQIGFTLNVPNPTTTDTPTSVVAVQTTTVTPTATSTDTAIPTEAASVTLTPSFTASSTETKAAETATPTPTSTFTPSKTPSPTVPLPVLGPSYTPTLGRGPAVTVVGVKTKTPTPTQTTAESQTAEASASTTDTATEASTEPATDQATATVEVTETLTATDTVTVTPTATSTPSPTRTPKPPTATPTATATPTQTATLVPTPNGLPSANLKQSMQEITFHDCKPEGSGGDPALNQTRNRVDDASQYPATAFDSIAKLPWPKDAEGKPRDQWSQETRDSIALAEGLPVTVEGYLIKVQENGPEPQNCNSTFHTWQLWLLGNPGSPNDLGKALVAGISPRVTDKHAGWTLDKLTGLAVGTKVRISAWLMFNEDQAGEVGKSRVSLWELHPVMQIAVAKGNQWVNLDDYQP